MPRLQELDAQFMQHRTGIAEKNHGRKLPDGTTQWGGFETEVLRNVDTLAEAESIMFGCPLCFAKNVGMKGTHHVLVTFAGRGVPNDRGSHGKDGKPTRWNVSGSGYGDLVCTPSVLLTPPSCGWHGFMGSSGVPPGHAA